MGYEPNMPSWSIPLRAHPFPHLSGTGLERSSGEEGSGRGQHAKEQKGTHGCVIRRNKPRDVSVSGAWRRCCGTTIVRQWPETSCRKYRTYIRTCTCTYYIT